MAIGSVVTRGYAVGSIPLVVRRGFAAAAAVTSTGPTITRGQMLRQDQALYDGQASTFKQDDFTGGTVEGLRIDDEVDVLQVFGGGKYRTAATIADLVRYIGDTVITARFSPGRWDISDSLTIPANITCLVKAGCIFDVASTKTLTFSGPVIVEHETWHNGTVTTSKGVYGFGNY